jgi:hypothetical protein
LSREAARLAGHTRPEQSTEAAAGNCVAAAEAWGKVVSRKGEEEEEDPGCSPELGLARMGLETAGRRQGASLVVGNGDRFAREEEKGLKTAKTRWNSTI